MIGLCLLCLRNMIARWQTGMVTIVAVATVVAVLASTLMMSRAIQTTLDHSAREGWSVVVRQGAVLESMSAISLASLGAIDQAITDLGELTVQRHLITTVVGERLDGVESSVVVRGLSAPARSSFADYALTAGRVPHPGVRELMVGQALTESFPNLDLEGEVVIENATWRIVGVFQARGIAGSELWGELDTLMGGLARTGVSALRIFNAAPDRLQARFDTHRLRLDVHSEAAFFAPASSMVVFEFIATFVSAVMAIGATFGAMNIMSINLESREVEIATLRALGFRRSWLLVALVFESMALAGLGALLGLLLSAGLFHGAAYATGSSASVATFLNMTVPIMLTASVWAMVVGVCAGVPPAWSGLRQAPGMALNQG